MTESGTHQPSFLIVAPVGRDGELIFGLLNACGFRSRCIPGVCDIKESDSSEAVGLILTDEALSGEGIHCLRQMIAAQPLWSDLPILLLTSAPGEPQNAAMASKLRSELRNVFLLDRPVRMETLLSAAQVAFNSRMRQMEVRDAAARQLRSEEALRNTEKLAVTGRLAATLAHEVNNPLEALGNLLFLIENSFSIDDARPLCRIATQELQRISDIVNQTLRFHRSSDKPGMVDIFEVAVSALALFRTKLGERRIQLDVRGTKTIAYCSAGEIRQAVVNLIGNAMDAMRSGGKLHIRVASIRSHGCNCARITVADTGSGIPREIRPNLFTQFFTTKGSGGTGLGLWLTRDIMQRNKGTLRFRSRTGSPSGTAFALYLPQSPRPAATLKKTEEPNGHNLVGVA